jgi:hypothetical protein
MVSEAPAARQTAQTPERAAARRLILYGLALVLIVAVNWLVYGNVLQPTLFRADDLALIKLAREYGPFSGFGGAAFDSLYRDNGYFRPIFTLQVWVMYRLFGLNHTGYQATILAIHILGVAVLFFALVRLGASVPTAAIAAAFYSVHPYVSELVIWVSDSAAITWLITMLILLVLPHHRENWKWYAGLGVLLFLAPISRETGLAIVGGAFVYAVAAYALGHLDRRAAAIVAALCVASVAVYFTLRLISSGALVRSVPAESASILEVEYTRDEVDAFPLRQERALYAYTVVANFTGPFFPIFTDVGALRYNYLAHVIVLTVVLGLFVLVLWLTRRDSRKMKRILGGGLGGAILLVGLVAAVPPVREAVRVPYTWLLRLAPSFAEFLYASVLGPNQVLELDPTVLMTFGIMYAALFSRKWTARHMSLALLGLSVIAAIAVMAFPYFRFRTLSVSLIGWLLLVVLAVINLRAGWFQKAVGALMLIMMVTATVRNGIWVHERTPPWYLLPANFTASGMCEVASYDDFVVEVAREYETLDPADLAACQRSQYDP